MMLDVNLPQEKDILSGNYFVINAKMDEGFEYKGYYNFGRVLGRGSFGTVVECLRKSDNKPIALKFFKHKAIHKWIKESSVISDLDENVLNESSFFNSKKSDSDSERYLPSEVACLVRASKLNGVVKLLDYLPASDDVHLESNTSSSESDNDKCSSNNNINNNDESIIGIVLERHLNEICLFDYLIEKDCLDESEAKFVLRQIVEVSVNLLRNGIFHGDLKSENILIDPVSKMIRIIDFGSAQLIDSTTAAKKFSRGTKTFSKPVRTFRGTNLYKPPEYLTHHCFYPRPSTVWTFGVILFDMVCGHFPFQNDAEILMHQDKEIIFTRSDLSDPFKDLVRKCLAFYVADRIVIDKILTHPWMATD